jgi:hypothetical protein
MVFAVKKRLSGCPAILQSVLTAQRGIKSQLAEQPNFLFGIARVP